MSGNHIFISHASADDDFVKQLRLQLESHGFPVWVDSRNLRGGQKLAPEIKKAITTAHQVIVVLSLQTVNSPWVRKEVETALKVEKRRKGDGYCVIPLLLPGLTPAALQAWFPEDPFAVRVEFGPGGLSEAFPAILEAMGERAVAEHESAAQPDAKPLDELVLLLSDPKIEHREGTRRVAATASLVYEPADTAIRRVESRRYAFTASMGPIEIDDLRWYLEQYFLWPVGVFRERADGIEKKLPQWGQELFKAALAPDAVREPLTAWRNAGDGAERRFSVHVDSDLPDGSAAEEQAAAREAASELLTLPWELLHDGRSWLFQGKHAARVRRRLPNRVSQDASATHLPIRVLLLSPRPEQDEKGDPVGYLDHRVSARPLIDSVETLGELVELTVLTPPTYAALDKTLQEAADRKEPFDVVHFDGHGVYDRRLGLGGLCFEDAKDANKLEKRTMDFVDATKLAGLFREHRVPLVFLEACQTALSELNPSGSVAASLLQEGVTSVVAMSHSVLVETARHFVEAFYHELALGARVGRAMLSGQRALYDDDSRGRTMGTQDFRLQDWFVPVLYQEKQDPQLIKKIQSEEVQQIEAKKRRLNLGDLPEEPPYKFRGRSRELLALERLLHKQPWAVVRGSGGAGKTTLAAELARWLTRTSRFERAAFVSLEHHRDARAVLDTIGHQLLPEGDSYSVAQFPDLKKALQPVERALSDRATIIVLDNCESVLPLRLATPEDDGDDETLNKILRLCKSLLAADRRTRLVFTTRESLPEPFGQRARERELGALERQDAIELVSQVMADEGLVPELTDPGSTPKEITDLVEAVSCHARALVLLAREVARQGVKGTTADLRALMAELERKHPGDRENSLYASVELSLRRLKPNSRERIKVLAVCQGGVHLAVLQMLTGLEPKDVQELASDLVSVGLGEDMGYGHLRLDPGLSPYLLSKMTAEEADTIRSAWAEAMAGFTRFLYEQLFKDTHFAATLTMLELPNLLSMLDWFQDRRSPERIVSLASIVETLFAELGRPQALKAASRVRELAAKELKQGGWNHARFVAESADIDRLLERGESAAAEAMARQLLQHTLAAGESAYPEAAYDIAIAYLRFGRASMRCGSAESALPVLAEAERRFRQHVDAGDSDAEHMVSITIAGRGDCLLDLGRLDEAADAYEKAIKLHQENEWLRDVAATKFQLGTVRMLQGRYRDALDAFTEARDTFEKLGEPRSVAAIWHQMGMVYQGNDQFDLAEQAHRRSLAIKVREDDLAGQGSSLNQLGNLYDAMGRLEQAVTFYRQCAEVFVRLKNLASEGKVRNNLADTLIKLRRYDEARTELSRGIDCKEPFGHTSMPWTTWALLEGLERATGHAPAAEAARAKAIQCYLAYRREGGVSQSNGVQLFKLVAESIKAKTERAASQKLNALLEPNDPPHFTVLISRLQSILAGDRDPALAEGAELTYMASAELQLLLESLRTQ